jgi:hypothetical protein|nr:MAG TPA: hypothetical protein [Caudoviricetes sp.]
MKRCKFENCHSIEQVVGFINESENKAKLTADYAYKAAKEKDNLNIEELEAQIEILIDSGVNVYYEDAQLEASKMIALKESLEMMMMNVSGSIYLGSDVNYLKAYGKEKYINRCRAAIVAAEEYLQELENE